MSFASSAEKQCVVVTGLPGSGKSTTGRDVAREIDFNFLDKDDYLEELFQQRGSGDLEWRQKLSRDSDKQFQQDAVKSNSVVLVSHWRPAGVDSGSGTPSEWLEQHFTRVVELYCSCPVEEATRRFIKRRRHPGHLDTHRTAEEILEWMTGYQRLLPLRLGILETICTNSKVQLGQIVGRLGRHVRVGR